MVVKSKNITLVEHRVDNVARWDRNGHRGGILWLTGLSGSGKSTLAFELERHLFQGGWHVYVLDGDNVRHGLCSDLGFSPGDRAENIRRIGEVASLFADAGYLVITAFISPYRQDRDIARHCAKDPFHEVYLSADVAECERRDPKGLYERARRGEIPEFTGVSAPYEAPLNPEVVVPTGQQTVDDSVKSLLRHTESCFLLHSGASPRRTPVVTGSPD